METIPVERAFVRVAGPEAEAYLQGQLSQDLADGPVGLSLLLEPAGKLVALLRWLRLATDEFLLDTDAAAGDAVLSRLRRFLLRTKAEVEPDEHRVVRVFGAEHLPQALTATPWSDVAPRPQDLLDQDPPSGAEPLDAAAYERRRILAGVPVCGVDVGPDTIPAEMGRWAIESAVSFTKGCYTGQELVARIDSRGGNVPRPLRVLQADGGEIATGAEVLDEGGQPVGTVTSASGDVALAPVLRRIEQGTQVRIAGGPSAVVVR